MSGPKPGTAPEERSLAGHVADHATIHEQAKEFAAYVSRMAAASEQQPVAAATKENLRQTAAMANAMVTATEGLHAAARRANEADIERAEEPRGGSRGIEQKADVVAAGADGL